MKHNFTDSKWGKEPPTFQSAVKSLNNSDGRMDHTCLNKSTNQKVFLFVFFFNRKKRKHSTPELQSTDESFLQLLTEHFFLKFSFKIYFCGVRKIHSVVSLSTPDIMEHIAFIKQSPPLFFFFATKDGHRVMIQVILMSPLDKLGFPSLDILVNDHLCPTAPGVNLKPRDKLSR